MSGFMAGIEKKLTVHWRKAKADPKSIKDGLRRLVASLWPDLPKYSTLDNPLIEEVKKGSLGCGVVPTFLKGGRRYVIMGVAGEHYEKMLEGRKAYSIPGGFATLTAKPGSVCVEADDTLPESGYEAANRELEEEIRYPDGAPVLTIAPERMQPVDTVTVRFGNGDVNILMSFAADLGAEEVSAIELHCARLLKDEGYRQACAMQSVNAVSGLPEFETVEIVPLDDLVDEKYELLHKDQMSLFKKMKALYDRLDRLSAYEDAMRSSPDAMISPRISNQPS